MIVVTIDLLFDMYCIDIMTKNIPFIKTEVFDGLFQRFRFPIAAPEAIGISSSFLYLFLVLET